MKILILNWRDIKNPAGGGAEILTHEMAKRWVVSGHTVTMLTAAFPKAIKEEIIDGVKIIRRGRWWNIHIIAFFLYFAKFRKATDVIIDEVHWFPFFAALYAPKKTIALTCEVASRLLFRIFPYPVALIFRVLEKIYLFLYRRVPAMVISPSTYNDLIATGHEKKSICILPMGITIPNDIKLLKKEKYPTIISLGRLNAQKGSLDILDAFMLIKKDIPQARLWYVGSGEQQFVEKLKKKIKKNNMSNSIIFYGFVSETEKFSLLARAHLLVSASVQEGWGLTVPEAGLMKTPSIVYNIEGFRDIIKQDETGILVRKNAKDLALNAIKLLQDRKKYKILQSNMYKNAKSYTWDKTAKYAITFIEKELI